MKFILAEIILLITFFKLSNAQLFQSNQEPAFTHSDTLRGSITPERAWWNVLRYDITVKPDYETKTISGKNIIVFNVTSEDHLSQMQLDLQYPMMIDRIILNETTSLTFTRDSNAWFVDIPSGKISGKNSLLIFFHGKPQEAKYPPWDGGWVWTSDTLGNIWMSAACQGVGASVWYPCKDHQSDEPDNGASLTMIVPSELTGVANGRLKSKVENSDGTTAYKWEVVNPINNYNIIPYIGKYVNYIDTYKGLNGILDIDMWILDYNLEKAKQHVLPELKRMFEAFEYWFGPYPFYEDSYKIVEAPYAGMEHQSAIAYGNKYKFGFWGNDLSRTGWGKKFDYMIVHESAHEWWGNNITTNDIADMWVHEGFGQFAEVAFIDYWYGKEAANQYNKGIRRNIANKKPIIGDYGVNNEGSGDMYTKGCNLLQTIRHSIDDDEKFRQIMKGLNKTFYHKTVDTKEVENFISENSGFDYGKVFDQYLRNIQIPKLEYYFTNDMKKVNFRYTDCIPGFNLPLVLDSNKVKIRILPTTQWTSMKMTLSQTKLFKDSLIEKLYYIKPTRKEKS